MDLWQFHYRWEQVQERGLLNVVAQLEERDKELEFILAAGFGTSCSIDFEYTYRWPQILGEPDPDTQVMMLDANMTALELAINSDGNCRLELPYRWDQIWPLMLAGDAEGYRCAEENDLTIERRFQTCTCGKPGTWGIGGTGELAPGFLDFRAPGTGLEDNGIAPVDITAPITLAISVGAVGSGSIQYQLERQVGATWTTVTSDTIAYVAGSQSTSVPVAAPLPEGARFRVRILITGTLADLTDVFVQLEGQSTPNFGIALNSWEPTP